jgi:hypothetical protein
MLRLGVTLGTAVSEAPAEATEVFASIEHAREGVTALAGAAARAAAGGYASTMRLQAMMGEVLMFSAAPWPYCILLLSSLRHQAHRHGLPNFRVSVQEHAMGQHTVVHSVRF